MVLKTNKANRELAEKPTGVDAKIRPLNGHNFSEEAVKETGLTQEEMDLADAEEALANKRLQIQKKKEEAQAEAQSLLLESRDKAKAAAVNYRKEARNCQDPDEKKDLYYWASEADAEVRRIEVELGLAVDSAPEEAADKLTFWQRNRWATALLQVGGVLAAILYFKMQFDGFREYIDELNKALPLDKQMEAYDVTSIQKLFYEKMVVFTDLPLALLMLFLVVPFIGFYVLPFLKSRKDFYTEFYEDLTPWQRSIITTVFCLGLLFYLALSHNVKP